MSKSEHEELLSRLIKRYGDINPITLERVLCPKTIPIRVLDKTIKKLPGQTHYRATFSISIQSDWDQLMQRGRTGKFVPKDYVEKNGVWREIAKGRIIDVDWKAKVANGEVYVGKSRAGLELALAELDGSDYLEIDQYGASAKVLSALVEYHLTEQAVSEGFVVRRMPEDMARHLGAYYHYDFEFEKNGVTKKVEAKSLWGTNTDYARLIHSKGGAYATSSCKFDTQDIFAVGMFLRTGKIRDFAFARSIPNDVAPHGLPRSPENRDYVHQNPVCKIGNGTWFSKISDVWNLA
jgi:hypothetical protein